MTHSDQTVCPRCGQPVKIGSMYLQIKPHRDVLVKAVCPTEGMTMTIARNWVETERAKIREVAAMTSSEQSVSSEMVVCQCCGHTEDLETAKELWAASYVGGHLFGWICADCWHSDAEERCR